MGWQTFSKRGGSLLMHSCLCSGPTRVCMCALHLASFSLHHHCVSTGPHCARGDARDPTVSAARGATQEDVDQQHRGLTATGCSGQRRYDKRAPAAGPHGNTSAGVNALAVDASCGMPASRKVIAGFQGPQAPAQVSGIVRLHVLLRMLVWCAVYVG